MALLVADAGSGADIGFKAAFDRPHARVLLTWSNFTADAVLVNLGRLTGNVVTLEDTVRMFIARPGMPKAEVVKLNQPAGVGGRIIPFVVCLLPGAAYSVAVEGKEWGITGSDKTLADLRDQKWTLSLRFAGRQPIIVDRDGRFVPDDGLAEYGTRMRSWVGSVETQLTN